MENSIDNLLPPEFRDAFSKYRITLCWENIARTFLLEDGNGINRYLKIQSVGNLESLELQAKKLLWLIGKLPVPEVVDLGKRGNFEYLITTEIIGSAASDKIFHARKEEVIELLAQGLRTIHEISIDNCPFDNRLSTLMNIMEHKANKGLINSSKLFRKFGEDNVNSLINEVESYARCLEDDLVFTHGDYSFPNIIISDSHGSGFIDLGNCGIADRYYDLAVAEKSIIMNYGKEYSDLFYQCYGIESVDQQKIRFFQIIEFLLWD